ncbi:MAG: tetratricopeptide repeat protein [Candidatus Cloacimonadota bacterium]|nr:tetratricopeptide repeat protein [Candidatus Cloacimonadota bacterium]
MKKIILILILCSVVLLNAKTWVREYTYNAGDADSKITSRAIALEEVQRLLLQEIGVFVYSTIQNETSEISGELKELTSKQVEVMTAGVTQTKILDEQWNGEIYYIKAEIEVDENEVIGNLDDLMLNDEINRELEESYQRTQEAYLEIDRLRKELAQVNNESKKIELQKDYEKSTQQLSIEEMIKRSAQALGNNDPDRAYKIMRNAFNLDPVNEKILYSLGTISFHKQEYQLAVDYLTQADNIKSNNPAILTNLATAYEALGKKELAYKLYKRAVKLKPDNVYALAGIAKYYENQGDFEKALKILKQIKNIAPRSHRLYVNFGSVLIKMKQYDKALIAYKRAIELNPKEGYYHYMMSLLYKEKGNYKKSLEHKKKAEKLGFENEKYD